MQLDNSNPIASKLWNWKANIDEGNNRLSGMRTECNIWLQNQIEQQMTDDESQPLENLTYSFYNGTVTFQEGTNRTMLDLLTIRRYNGDYILYWRRKDNNHDGAWVLREDLRQYIDDVCGRIGQ